MFDSISKFFSVLSTNLNTIHILSSVGEDYAKAFKADAQIKLDAKAKLLAEQQAL